MTLKSYLGERGAASTRQTYFYLLKRFLLGIYPGSGGRTVEDFEPLAARYLEEIRGGRDLAADLREATKGCNTTKTSETLRSAVLEFLRHHDIFPDERTLYKMKKGRPPIHVTTVDKPLKPDDVLKILGMMDARARAVTLLMVSSGMRVGEVLNLKMGNGKTEDDIDLDARPARVIIRQTKTGAPRISFISQEAVEAIREYLKVRDGYVGSARARAGVRRGKDGSYLFPIHYQTFQAIWALAVKKAGVEKTDPRTGRLTLTAHSCRKFFMSRMKAGGVPEAIIETIVGHAGYLGSAYARFTEEELAQAYSRGEPNITIAKAVSSERMATKIRKLEAEVERLKKSSLAVDVLMERYPELVEMAQSITPEEADLAHVVAETGMRGWEDVQAGRKTLEEFQAEMRPLYKKQVELGNRRRSKK